jgi:valyl-tRNA synthetase
MVGTTNTAYFYGDGKEDFVVAESIEEALGLAKVKTNNQNLTTQNLTQDVDALDTWFSLWLWPMSVFGGIMIQKVKILNIIIQPMI